MTIGRLGRFSQVYYGWFVVGACFTAAFVGLGTSYSFGVFFREILADFERSRSIISGIFSLQTLVLYLSAASFGAIVDRIGTRRLMLLGVFFFSGGLVATSQVQSLRQLYLTYGLVTAVGMGILFILAYGTIPRWFERRRGLAMGITSTGLGMGMLIVPALSQFLIDRTDWRTAFLLLAVPFTVVLIVAAVIIRGRPTRVCVDKSVEFETSPSEVSREDNHTGLRTQITRRFALVFVGWVLIFGPLYVLFGHLAAYSGDLGLPQWVGAISLSVIGASGIIARLAVGRISDRVGVVRPFVGSAAIMGLVPLILPLASRELTLLALAALFGIGYGGVDALLSPLVAALFQDTSVYSLLGVMSLSFALSGLLAPYLAGITFDILGSYVPAFLAVGFVGLCGSSVVFIVSRLSAV